mgnify:CR=1 FL=1
MNKLKRINYIAAIVAMFTNTLERINFNAGIVVMSTNTLERNLINVVFVMSMRTHWIDSITW